MQAVPGGGDGGAAAYVASDDEAALVQIRRAAAGMGPDGVAVMAVRVHQARVR
jgi:hypothetical protein